MFCKLYLIKCQSDSSDCCSLASTFPWELNQPPQTEFTIVFPQECCHFCSRYSDSSNLLCFICRILVRYHYFSPFQQVFVLMASQHISHHLFGIQQSFCFSRCLEKELVFYGDVDSNFPMAIPLIPLRENRVISEDMAAVSH